MLCKQSMERIHRRCVDENGVFDAVKEHELVNEEMKHHLGVGYRHAVQLLDELYCWLFPLNNFPKCEDPMRELDRMWVKHHSHDYCEDAHDAGHMAKHAITRADGCRDLDDFNWAKYPRKEAKQLIAKARKQVNEWAEPVHPLEDPDNLLDEDDFTKEDNR